MKLYFVKLHNVDYYTYIISYDYTYFIPLLAYIDSDGIVSCSSCVNVIERTYE